VQLYHDTILSLKQLTNWENEMNYENRYSIVKEKSGTWTIFLRTGDVFQEGFDSKEDAIQFLNETFG
jgi:hypothetical protein